MARVAFFDNTFVGVEIKEAPADLGAETLAFKTPEEFFRPAAEFMRNHRMTSRLSFIIGQCKKTCGAEA